MLSTFTLETVTGLVATVTGLLATVTGLLAVELMLQANYKG